MTPRRPWRCSGPASRQDHPGAGSGSESPQSRLKLLTDFLLVRRLPPWHSDLGKRLVKTPNAYVRDNDLVRALLDLADQEEIMSPPAGGAS